MAGEPVTGLEALHPVALEGLVSVLEPVALAAPMAMVAEGFDSESYTVDFSYLTSPVLMQPVSLLPLPPLAALLQLFLLDRPELDRSSHLRST